MAFQVLSHIKHLRDPLDVDDRTGCSTSTIPKLSPTIRSMASKGENMATSSGNPSDGGVGKEDDTVESKGITFANQNSLPKLPIPDLESTCSKYLEALAPLQSTKEHETTRVAVKEFMEAEGPGLQEKLKKYATSKSSYIEQFWYDSYLNFDNPVVLNLNPFFLLADDPTPARNNQVTRAASLVVSALSFVRAVRKEELAPDTVRGKPLCMFQYSRLFGTARVPTPNGCVIGQDSASRHLVVLCRGQFYWFDVLDEDNNHLMSEKDISMNLRVIIDDAERTPTQEAAKGAVGVLSTESRKVWSKLRDILTQDGNSNNAECLNIVDTALFVLCLDSTEPSSVAELCGNMLCGTSQIVRGVQIGTCTNRWYDKLQIIVCKNGSAGINFEHTGVDGHTVLRFASDVYTDTILRFARTINGQAPSLWASSSPPPCKRDTTDGLDDASTTPHKLEWDMGPELSTALRFAESHLADLLRQHEFETLDFAGYGKNFITSMGFSPDAFVQMAFQAAYYGLYGRIETTYEPAMTKFFLHGRTEAIRTVSAESTEFVKTFWGDNPAAEKVRALKRACEKHVDITRTCSKGLGQDRHLYALYCLWQRSLGDGAAVLVSDGESSAEADIAVGVQSSTPGSRSRQTPTTPTLFSDPGWDRINNTILSTSNCGNPALRHFGFGPTSGDGFGIGYIIKDDTISICASSKHRQTSRFMDTLDSYLVEIRKLLRATIQSRARGKAAVSDSAHKQAGTKSERKGRVIRTESLGDMDGIESGDDDGMGGYGFFDAGMLLHALKGVRTDEREDSKASSPRRLVGKSLKFSEY